MNRLNGACWIALVAFCAFSVLPAIADPGIIADLSVYFSYALFAVSLSLVWGQVGLLSLGHGVFFGVGAYAMSVLTLGMVPGFSELASSWAGLLTAVAAGGALAFLIGLLCFAGEGIKGAFFGIVTLALAYIGERLVINSTWLGGMNGLLNVPPITINLNGEALELTDALPVYYMTFITLTLVIVGLLMLTAGSYGALLNAIRDNELRIWTLGANVRKIKVLTYALSGAIAGLAGALFVAQFGFTSPSLIGSSLSLDVVIWVAIGGRDNIVAAALGAIGVRLLENCLADQMGDAWPLALGLLFMLSVIFFPKGVFGSLIDGLDRRLIPVFQRSSMLSYRLTDDRS